METTEPKTETTNALIVQINQSGLETETSKSLMDAFLPFYNQVMEWKEKAEKIVVTSSDQLREMKQAKDGRLIMKGIRVEVEKRRKGLKEDSLREGKAIDGVANVLESLIGPIEGYLAKQENFAAIQEANRLDALKESRIEALSPYEAHLEFYDLRNMPEEAYQQLFDSLKRSHEDKIAEKKRIEQDEIRKKEVRRLAEERSTLLRPYYSFYDDQDGFVLTIGEASEEEFNVFLDKMVFLKSEYDAEQERIKLENERLKKEAEEKAKIRSRRSAELRPYIVFIREYDKMLDMPEDEYAKEFEEVKGGAELQWEFDKKQLAEKAKEEANAETLRVEQEAKLKKEREARERAESELKAKEDAVAQAKIDEQSRKAKEERDRKAAESKALKAPDKSKLLELANRIKTLELPSVKSEDAQRIILSVSELLGKVDTFIQEQVSKL